MNELLMVMVEIRDLLISIDGKLDAIRGSGLNSIDDVCNELATIRGTGINSIDDVCNKLDNIDLSITLI